MRSTWVIKSPKKTAPKNIVYDIIKDIKYLQNCMTKNLCPFFAEYKNLCRDQK